MIDILTHRAFVHVVDLLVAHRLRRHDIVHHEGFPRVFPPIAPLMDCPFHSKHILDEAIGGGSGSAGSAIFA